MRCVYVHGSDFGKNVLGKNFHKHMVRIFRLIVFRVGHRAKNSTGKTFYLFYIDVFMYVTSAHRPSAVFLYRHNEYSIHSKTNLSVLRYNDVLFSVFNLYFTVFKIKE